jgi:hypothetical protein
LAAYAGLLGFKPEKPQAPAPVNPENHRRDFLKRGRAAPYKTYGSPMPQQHGKALFQTGASTGSQTGQREQHVACSWSRWRCATVFLDGAQ